MNKINKNTSKSGALVIRILACVTLLIFFASGCAGGKLGTKTFTSKFYADCHKPVDELRADAEKLGTNVLGGAVMGAVAGGVAGALLGGKTEDVILGAVLGAVAGAGISYLVTKEVQEKAQAERYDIYSQSLDGDFKNLESAITAARLATACYKNTYKQLTVDYQAGRISKEDMQLRLEEIRAGANDAKLILKAYNDAAEEQVGTYAEIVKLEKARTTDKLPAKSVKTIEGNAKKIEEKRDEGVKVMDELEDFEVALLNTVVVPVTAMAPSDFYALVASLDSSSTGCHIPSGKI